MTELRTTLGGRPSTRQREGLLQQPQLHQQHSSNAATATIKSAPDSTTDAPDLSKGKYRIFVLTSISSNFVIRLILYTKKQSLLIKDFSGSSSKNVPTSKSGYETKNAKTETIQNKEDSESTISSSQTFNSSKAKASTAQEPKPMSQISGVRRDLSRIESVDTDIIHLPKYGVKTDRETELGEVLKFYVYYFKTL